MENHSNLACKFLTANFTEDAEEAVDFAIPCSKFISACRKLNFGEWDAKRIYLEAKDLRGKELLDYAGSFSNDFKVASDLIMGGASGIDYAAHKWSWTQEKVDQLIESLF